VKGHNLRKNKSADVAEERFMAINKAFLGHGIFTQYSVNDALTQFKGYQSPNPHRAPRDQYDTFIFALQDMKISTVWIQLFTRSQSDPTAAVDCDLADGGLNRKTLIARLDQAGINWAGWGYCSGKNWRKSKTLIETLHHDLGMTAFVIDAEPGNLIYKQNPTDDENTLPDIWDPAEFKSFVTALNTEFKTENLAISTWPILQLQDEPANPVIQLMKNVAPLVCLFAPQAYWMGYPGDPHYKKFDYVKYPRDDSTAFVRLVIDAWQQLSFVVKPSLVVTAQAYWEISDKGGSPSRETMEMKIKQLALNMPDADFQKILGLNWYYAGLPKDPNSKTEGSMSNAMIRYIGDARFDAKPYKPG
jgi:hypothetical protein